MRKIRTKKRGHIGINPRSGCGTVVITKTDCKITKWFEITRSDIIRLLDPNETWPIRVNGLPPNKKAYVELDGATTTISFTSISSVEVSTADFFFHIGQLLPSED